MQVADSILSLIGNTPLLKLTGFDTGPCTLYLKLEGLNPGGSIKDRIALSMVEAAEKSGQLKPGGHLVEATAGNTGLALAMIAQQKGYKLTVVLPDKMSQEKVQNLKGMGAEVVMTTSTVTSEHPDYFHNVAKRIAEKDDTAFWVNQFANEANIEAHYKTTGPELWEQTDGKIDAFVCGVGSGGTLTGVGRYLKTKNENVQMVLADPKGSVLADYVKTGVMPEAGSWQVEGVGEDYVPVICDLSLVDAAHTISDETSFDTARAVLAKTGLCVGTSSGTLIAAALEYCRAQTSPKTVVTLACDTGCRYLSKLFK